MAKTPMQTQRLNLVPLTREQCSAKLETLSPEQRKEVSPLWLAKFATAAPDDPWTYGFDLVHRETGVTLGGCAFKGPPTSDGAVEIAYGVDPDHQGKGYATEAAEALTQFAFNHDRVRVVIAHTLPKPSASTRVLTKSGFQCTGEVIDPEDGPVWRWEKRRPA
jgi:RimJ/RimL family protein N-acetyltransferase